MTGSFLEELRRRKVVRVALAYVVAAFIVLQAADLVLEPLGLPPWTMTLVIVLAALGFVPALILAWAFDWTPQGVKRTGPALATGASVPAAPAASARSPAVTGGRWPLGHRALVTGAAFVLGVAGIAFVATRGERDPAPALDANAVAVLPFRVAADPTLDYLGAGMVDLLAAKLTGEGGPRAVDSRSVLRLWERATQSGSRVLDRTDALVLARTAGAGQLLLGEIVGAPGRLTLSATLHDVGAGSAGTPATVSGPVDSLPWLVDRLVAELLSVRAGQEGRRLAHLTSASLPALQAYLAGKQAYRGGRFADAAAHFRRAVEIDSTFALAGLDLIVAGMWAEGGPQMELGRRIAWQGRDRLPARERRRLDIMRGGGDFHERLAGWEAEVRETPDDAEAWFMLGELLLHNGPAVGRPDAFAHALSAFERAVAIDSIYAPALYHAIEIRARNQDTAQVRRLARIYFHRNAPESGYHSYIGWRTALALRDDSLLAALRDDGFAAVPYYDLRTIAELGQSDGLPLRDVELALTALERRAGTTEDRTSAARARTIYLLNAGRPAEAARVVGRMPGDELHMTIVRAAVFWDGDVAAADAAAARLESMLAGAAASDMGAIYRIVAMSALEERRLDRGDTSRAAATIAAIRSLGSTAIDSAEDDFDAPGARRIHPVAETAAAYLAAWHAALVAGTDAPQVAVHLATLDSLLSTGFPGSAVTTAVGNIIAARLHAARGNYEAGLDAARRRPYWSPPPLLSTLLLEEARLAERVGDTDGARRAYAHYLHLRQAAEPALAEQLATVRRELESSGAARVTR